MVKPASFLLGCFLLVLYAVAPAAEITAQLDRQRIVQGETVTLSIETDDPQQSLETDFSALDSDFELVDRRSESQMSIVNGQQSATVRLLLTLEPRHSGELTVPPLHFGKITTSPLKLTVDAAPEPEPGEAPTVFIEVEVEPKNGPYYVHAQLQLTVRVFYQQSLTEAAISQPEPTPASVRLLNEVPFQADRGGVHYRVLERHYAVFPERSGPLQIPPMKLSGRLVERRSDRLWQPTVRGRRIEVTSDAIDLTIQPKPASFTGDAWLPARSLQLTQTVSANDSLKVGEPVTRTVIVDAVGLEENMITPPAWPELADARIYPDQPQGISRNDGDWVLGHKEFRYAVVPEKEGELILPKLSLHWWDTVNDREQTAVLPERRLKVLPSNLAPAAPEVPAAPEASVTPAAMAAPLPRADETGRYWHWLTLLFATLWLTSSGLLFWQWRGRTRKPSVESAGKEQQGHKEKEVLESLKRACSANDAALVRRTLNQWLRGFGPKEAAGSILVFADQSASEDLKTCLKSLDAIGFSSEQSGQWSGAELSKAFFAWLKQWRSDHGKAQTDLTDLYAR